MARRILALAFLLALAACSREPGRSPGPAPLPGPVPAEAPAPAPPRVGFDVDDTLVFSTPAFDAAFDAEGVEPYSEAFWKILNGSDEGRSRVKKKSREIFERHRAEGAEIYAITSRHPPGGEAFREYLRKTFGIPPDRVFFETGRKTDRIRELRLSVYYGDSDSDIEDAIDAGARGVRIRRSQKSSNIKATHPGKFGEEVVAGSED